MATHSSILAWKISWTEEPGGLQSMGSQESGMTEQLTLTYLGGTAEFSKFAGILSAALSQHHLSGFEIAQLEFHHLH